MFTAKIMEGFSAAHSLRGYQGDCERLHGHNYRVEASVETTRPDEAGIVMDFRDLRRMLRVILDELDHRYLNECRPFTTINPSAENIAHHVFHRLSTGIMPPARLKEVTVWESDSCCATYSE